jgi:quercetin dioxygenase-like cupin family protein
MPKRIRFIQHLAEIKLSGAETGGTISVVEIEGTAGPAAPLHVHRREDETAYVLDGELTFLIGNEVVHARQGDVVHLPRDVPHTYTIDSPSASHLVIAQPAGFERFVERLGEVTDPEPEQIAAVAAEFGIEVLGPPMEIAA